MNAFWKDNSQNSEEEGILIAEQESKDRCGVCGQPLVIRTYLRPQNGRTYLLVECPAGHIRYRPQRRREF